MAINSQISPDKIAICMGSQSDWRTMQDAAGMLDDLGVAYEVRTVSYTHLTLPTNREV